MDSQLSSDPFNQPTQPAWPTQSHEYGPATAGERPTSPPMSLYAQQNPYPYPALPVNDKGGGQAVAGLILGIISLFAWFIFFCGVLFNNASVFVSTQTQNMVITLTGDMLYGNILAALVGVVFSALGLRSRSRKGLATAGLILSLLGLVLAVGIILFAAAELISEI